MEYTEEAGTLYYFKYMLADEIRTSIIPVATTRPETILGDTAVAVHPEDERYQHFIGKNVIVPILGREIPVIADEYVSTRVRHRRAEDHARPRPERLRHRPAPRPADHLHAGRGREGQRERRPVRRAWIASSARKKLWADMKAAGLVIKTEPYTHHRAALAARRRDRRADDLRRSGSCSIEPLAEAALAAVRDGRIKIVPERFAKVYYNWLENIQDWCISRQLWWGHRIPVWYCADCGKHDRAPAKTRPHCAHCGSTNIDQDPDVLDTWFSSGLWPFSTLGWPDETPDLKYFYPTSLHGDRLRHPVLLGGAHDHDGAGVHRRGALPHRLPARPGPRRARAARCPRPRAT